MKFSRQKERRILCWGDMKELLITFITLAGLFIGITCYGSIMGNGQADSQKTEVPASGH